MAVRVELWPPASSITFAKVHMNNSKNVFWPSHDAKAYDGRSKFDIKNLDRLIHCKKKMLHHKAAAGAEIKEVDGLSLEEAKKAVLRAVANTNRGKDTTLEQRKQILKLINELEDVNPSKDPVNSPLLSGYWSLLYTVPVDEKTADKYAGTQEGPFLARIKPLAFGSIKQTRSSQVIDVANGVAKNIADFTIFKIDGTLTIKGKAAPSTVYRKETVRLDVVFEEFVLRVGSWTSPIVSLNWIKPQGWIETTFLDEDFRVGRGDKGSIFMSARLKSDNI